MIMKKKSSQDWNEIKENILKILSEEINADFKPLSFEKFHL